MGRVRNILDLGLAIGAIAGAIAVLSPQVLWESREMQTLTAAQASDHTQDALPLAQFIGIGQFVKNPTHYSVVIDKKAVAVTGASLEGDHMVIEYSESLNKKAVPQQKDSAIVGKLTGKVNSDGTFEGKYQKASGKESTPGDVAFTFKADGTARSGKHSSDTVKIIR